MNACTLHSVLLDKNGSWSTRDNTQHPTWIKTTRLPKVLLQRNSQFNSSTFFMSSPVRTSIWVTPCALRSSVMSAMSASCMYAHLYENMCLPVETQLWSLHLHSKRCSVSSSIYKFFWVIWTSVVCLHSSWNISRICAQKLCMGLHQGKNEIIIVEKKKCQVTAHAHFFCHPPSTCP